MSISLQKRQDISLNKKTKITLGLSWSENNKGRTVTETVQKKGFFNRLIRAKEEVTKN